MLPQTPKDNEKDGSSPLPAPLIAHALERTQIAKYHTKGGHGFTAEDANHFSDLIRGRQAEVVGVSNDLNGADRVIDGILVQSKYYQTAAETVSSAFDSTTGNYRYTGQLLEVPNDQYESCIEVMRNKISQGRVPGYENPSDAEKLVRQGTVTYKQARNIARAGNIDSLTFDAKTQAVTSSYVFALSFAVSFARCKWSGESSAESAKVALSSSIAAGGTTLIAGILAAQALRTRAAAVGVVGIRGGLRSISTSTIGRAAIHRIASGSLGRAVHGAAAVNHVSKLLRSNAVTASIVMVVTMVPDFCRASIARSISWKQFAKNTAVNAGGVGTGTVGWLGGVAVGAAAGSIVPVIGTAAGGLIGGIAGAVAGSIAGAAVVKAIADCLVEDDSKAILSILDDVAQEIAVEYLLSEKELEEFGKQVRKTLSPTWLRFAFKLSNKGRDLPKLRTAIREAFEPIVEIITSSRPAIELPQPRDVAFHLIEISASLEAA